MIYLCFNGPGEKIESGSLQLYIEYYRKIRCIPFTVIKTCDLKLSIETYGARASLLPSSGTYICICAKST